MKMTVFPIVVGVPGMVPKKSLAKNKNDWKKESSEEESNLSR